MEVYWLFLMIFITKTRLVLAIRKCYSHILLSVLLSDGSDIFYFGLLCDGSDYYNRPFSPRGNPITSIISSNASGHRFFIRKGMP